MKEDCKLFFLEGLTKLLKGEVKPKSEDVRNGELFCDALKSQITKLFEETHKLDVFSDEFNLREFLLQHIDFPLERMKEQMEKTWLRDKLTIGLMGHFSTGKTTALNLLFGETFQTNRHENTALATYLTYGLKLDVVTIVDKSGQSQDLSMDECSILDYSSSGIKDFPFARIFNYMVKENSNKALKELTIIDTPGLFSSSSGHSMPTLNVVSSCDAVFWFINITDSFKNEDIQVIKDSLGELPLYFVFSFVDARGTSPQEVESSVERILKEAENNGVNCKGYLKLGKKEGIQSQFKNEAFEILHKLSDEHNVYIPAAHIMEVINFLEGFLVKCKNDFTEQISLLDSETDKLRDDYRASCRTFVTEGDKCVDRFNDMVATFRDRCDCATFCGGASNALRNNINSVSASLNKMRQAYNDMDVSKIEKFGYGVANMRLLQYKLEKISEILSNLTELKNALQ